ncbi:hypothetical protein [Streptomyces cupreus]|uniref:Uncharacterized protein n=1 Tax=Streptomyces cupreus TaxID=2759956 RepID=A0A7X1J4T5_9ACTN|nr:hypothetical protein [Streptomyces cupreus]MBC2903197.1 hypothetical protein [Streptomyces cupreus]
MIDRITVGAASLMGALVTAAGVARWYVRPEHAPGRHRSVGLLPPLEDLIGPPSEYTAVDPCAETQAFGVVRIGLGWCDVCWETKAGVITRNGFRCDDFTSHPTGGAL